MLLCVLVVCVLNDSGSFFLFLQATPQARLLCLLPLTYSDSYYYYCICYLLLYMCVLILCVCPHLTRGCVFFFFNRRRLRRISSGFSRSAARPSDSARLAESRSKVSSSSNSSKKDSRVRSKTSARATSPPDVQDTAADITSSST
jgi:hypothetical protein